MPKLKCSPAAYTKRIDRIKREADYAFARSRVERSRHRKQKRNAYRADSADRADVYALATHFAEVIASRTRVKEPSLKEQFEENVQRWKRETGHSSSITKSLSHRSYLRVIGLSKYSQDHELEKLLLAELKSEPDHWFAALTAITGEDPLMPEDDFDTAVQRWLDWGSAKGII